MDDFFALFNLPQTFALDADDLAARYRRLQAAAHPDAVSAAATDAERRAALQMSARINDAYQTLRDPLARAAHLLQLRGIDAFDEQNTAMSPAFLAAQMERREALEDAANDQAALAALAAAAAAEVKDRAARLAELLDKTRDDRQAAAAVRELKYLQKFKADIAAARDAAED